MKKIVLSAALIVASSAANAAVYEFNFDSEISTYLLSPSDPDFETFSGKESPITANLAVDVTSIENADFSASFVAGGGVSSSGGTLLTASASAGGFSIGIEPIAFGKFRFETDASGGLTSIFADVANDTPDLVFGVDQASWGSCCEAFYTAEGSWSVAPVPLPASAFLLVGAIGALGATRRRKTTKTRRLSDVSNKS